jgi:hypothetical protein
VPDKKEERVWIDPPGVNPELTLTEAEALKKWEYLSQYSTKSNLMKRWQLMFIGLLYLFTGVAIQIAVEFGITIDIIQTIFLVVGFTFISLAMLLYKKTGESRFQWK